DLAAPCAPGLPDTRSFPTRRSSDLDRAELERPTRDLLALGERAQLDRVGAVDGTRTVAGGTVPDEVLAARLDVRELDLLDLEAGDRKSTRLNSSHVKSSYAVFCLNN